MAEESKGSAASEATKSGLVTLVVGTNNSGKTILLERIANIPRLMATPGGATRSPTQRGVKFAVKYNMESCTAKLNSPAIQDSRFQYEYLVSQEREASEAARAMIGNAFRATEPCVLTGGDGDLGVKIQRSEATFAVPQWTKRASLFFDDDALQRLDTAKAAFSKRHAAYLRQVFVITNGMKLTKAWFREIVSKQLEVRPPYDANRDWVDHDGRHAARFHFAVKGLPGANDSDIEYTAQEMGMGARSLLGVLLFLDSNQGGRILCVDEPAQFLHPPQAELLGAMISKYAIDNRCHVFVSTHSLPLMRGLMGTVLCDGGVVDMVQCNDGDKLGYVSVERVKELCGYGHVVISGLLEAFSHDLVVITENYKDALAYMAAMPMVCPDVDVFWLGTGGAGEAKIMQQLARRLGIHAVALVDFDQLKQGLFLKMTPQCTSIAGEEGGDKPPKELQATPSLRKRVEELVKGHAGYQDKRNRVQWLRKYIMEGDEQGLEHFQALFDVFAHIAAETDGGIAFVPFGALEKVLAAESFSKNSTAGSGHARHMGRLKQALDGYSVEYRKARDAQADVARRECWPQPAELPKRVFAALYPQVVCMFNYLMWVASRDRCDAYATVQAEMSQPVQKRSAATMAAVNDLNLGNQLTHECLGEQFVSLVRSGLVWLGAGGDQKNYASREAVLRRISEAQTRLKQQTAAEVATLLGKVVRAGGARAGAGPQAQAQAGARAMAETGAQAGAGAQAKTDRAGCQNRFCTHFQCIIAARRFVPH